MPANILTEILHHKAIEIAQHREIASLEDLKQQIEEVAPPLDFEAALRQPPVNFSAALIAEVKKASPSKGLISPNFDPSLLAATYGKAGAAALSVLTDEKYFQGHLAFIELAKRSAELAAGRAIPVLRKDFMIDPYQVWQARAFDADAILIIMAAVSDGLAEELNGLAHELAMAVLVEVHNTLELERALRLQPRLLGINNRDLETFAVDMGTTGRLAQLLPSDFEGLLVAESGIATTADVTSLYAQGARAMLIGETLVRSASTATGLDPQALTSKIEELFSINLENSNVG